MTIEEINKYIEPSGFILTEHDDEVCRLSDAEFGTLLGHYWHKDRIELSDVIIVIYQVAYEIGMDEGRRQAKREISEAYHNYRRAMDYRRAMR